jgi:anti-sigma regulatory factor (Ser/Thr protein kinase)
MTASPADRTADNTAVVPVTMLEQQFGEPDLVSLRQAVAAHSDNAGLTRSQVYQLTLVAYELATNAVRHGGGAGTLILWRSDGSVWCRVSDQGPGLPSDYQLPHRPPEPGAMGGRGLWLATQLSDALHIDNTTTGATLTARMHIIARNGQT